MTQWNPDCKGPCDCPGDEREELCAMAPFAETVEVATMMSPKPVRVDVVLPGWTPVPLDDHTVHVHVPFPSRDDQQPETD